MSTIVKDNNKKYLAIAFKHLLTALLIAIIGSWCFQLLYPAIAGVLLSKPLMVSAKPMPSARWQAAFSSNSVL